jgi:hypothetical protein
MKDDSAENTQRKITKVPVIEYTRDTSPKYEATDIGITGYEILLRYFNLVWWVPYEYNPRSGFITT